MFNYQSYSEYKLSKIEGADAIPEHWDPMRFRYLFSIGRGLSITKENLQDIGIPCVNYGEIHSKYGFELNLQKHPLKCVSEEYLNSSPNSLLNKGDFVFADTSEDMEGSGNFTQLVSNNAIFAGYHTVIARKTKNHNDRYLAYALDSNYYRNQIRRAVKGVKVFSITQAILKDTTLLLPALSEQQQIASFLDQETTRIDTLIKKKTRFIELLKEKRQALISHAVTKGLNTDVEMKDSGVEWFGEIPKHWGVKKVKYVSNLKSGANLTSEQIESSGKCKVYGGNGLRGFYDDFTHNGTHVLIGRQGALCGNIHYAKDKFWATDHAVVATPIDNYEVIWFGELLRLMNLNQYSLASAQPGISVDVIQNLSIPFPALGEQSEITIYIKLRLNRIDKLSEKTQQSISLLKEHRVALINAAVTGKIDVRNYAEEANNKEVA